MTVTGLVRCRDSVLPVLCIALAAGLLAACSGDQPTSETAPQDIGVQPISETAPQPTANPEIQFELNPTWFVAPSLEEQIYNALTSDSLVVVRASLSSTTASAEAVSGATTYRPVHELKFTVHEYLEGSGPSEILVVVRGDETYATEALARGAANSAALRRNTSWDNREAVLFVGLGDTTAESDGGASTRKASFSRSSNPLESPWDYTVDNLSRAWLPAQATTGGASGEAADPEFITDGAQSPPPTIALAALKTKIAVLKAELKAGESIAGFNECIRGRILHERVYRADPGGPRRKEKALASGLTVGTEVFKYTEPFQGDPTYNRGWLDGPDSSLFQAVTIDDDKDPWNGYNLGFSTARPLPAGTYRVHHVLQHYKDLPCNFKPKDAYSDWRVTVTAPTGTVHEAFFDPVTLTAGGVGANSTEGVLKPAAFTAGGQNVELESLAWSGGSAVLTLDTHVSLSGNALDVIALDGTGAVTLAVADAAVDQANATWTWSVAAAPWKNGDKLMLRLRDATAAAPPTPAPTP